MPSYVSNSKIGRRTVPEVVAGTFPLPVDGLSFSMRRTLLAAEIESDRSLRFAWGSWILHLKLHTRGTSNFAWYLCALRTCGLG